MLRENNVTNCWQLKLKIYIEWDKAKIIYIYIYNVKEILEC